MDINLKEELIKSAEKSEKILQLIKEQPEAIITEVFNGSGAFNDITRSFELFEDKKYTVYDFQKYLYGLLIPFVKSKLDDDLAYTFDVKAYPCNLKISYEGYTIAWIDIYRERILTEKDLSYKIKGDKERIRLYKSAINEKKEKLEEMKSIKEDPFKHAKGFKEYIFLIFHRKEKRFIDDINSHVLSYRKRIGDWERVIESTREDIRDAQEKKDIIATRSKDVVDFFVSYGYSVSAR